MKVALFDDTLKYYNALLNDIEKAHQFIFMEFYRFGNDAIGSRFRDALARKAREGVSVKLLLDSWGTNGRDAFFAPLTEAGGEVRFHEKLRFSPDFFTRNHRRNHRKITIIDDKISYIGSSNLTDYNIVWRELILRLNGPIALTFKKIFVQMYDLAGGYLKVPSEMKIPLTFHGLEIIRDIPSITFQPVKKKMIKLIRYARRNIVVETPYFLPSFLVRKALINAVRRGVDVNIIIPRNSDVGIVDILRNRYLGPLHEKGIRFSLYTGQNLHAKLLMTDNNTFAMGSPNFDYRSFRFQHEILMVGYENDITRLLVNHVSNTLADTIPFDYEGWKNRNWFIRLREWILIPLRHLL